MYRSLSAVEPIKLGTRPPPIDTTKTPVEQGDGGDLIPSWSRGLIAVMATGGILLMIVRYTEELDKLEWRTRLQMNYSLRGTTLGGGPSLGGVWDDLFGGSGSSTAPNSNFTECPAGFRYDYNPSTNTGQCLPEASGVQVKIDGASVNPYQPTGTDCPVGFSYVKRADGTGSCVANSNVTTTAQGWGTTNYTKGGDSFNPSGDKACPTGWAWSAAVGRCIGSGTPKCPAGSVVDIVNNTCNKSSGGGSVAPKPAPQPVVVEPPVQSAGFNPVYLVAGVLLLGAGVLVVKKLRDKQKYAANEDCYDEEC